MNTAQKLWLGFSTLTGIIILVVIVVFGWVSTIGSQIDEISIMAGSANQAAHRLEIKANELAEEVSAYLQSSAPTNRPMIERQSTEFSHLLGEYRSQLHTSVELELADQIADIFQRYRATRVNLMDMKDRATLSVTDMALYLDLRAKLDDEIDKAQAIQEARIEPAREKVIRSVGRLQWSLLLLLLCGAGVAILAGLAISHGILYTEDALRESSERKAAILENALDGILTIDQHGTLLEFNPAAERIFGYRSEEVVGKEMAQVLIPPEFHAAHRAGLRLRTEQGGISRILGQRLELTALRQTGECFPVELAIIRIGTDKRPIFTGFVRDISEAKRAEAEMREQMELLQLGSDVGAALTKGDDLSDVLHGCTEAVVRNLNAAFARIWLFEEQENVLLLKASSGMYTHLDGAHARIPVGQFKIGRIAAQRQPHLTNSVIGDSQVPEQEWAKREGMVAFVGFPLLVDKHLMGVIGMFFKRPVSETLMKGVESITNEIAIGIRHELSQQALLQSFEQLEDRVTERTCELNASNQALVRSNRELEQFASVASHDLQEPLRKIQAFGERLNSQHAPQLNEQAQQYIVRMQSAATRMRTLIDDLLTFSRITTKAKPFEQVDLAEIAQEVLSDLEGRLHDTDGRVIIGELPTIQADPLQIRQLLQNLLSNGLKFRRPEVSPVVQVESHEDPENSEFVVIRVTDNGVGFDETYLDRIFEVFQRLHGRQEYEGTGMGLAISRKIVERHGGSITARSQPGEGAMFIVRLPKDHPELDIEE